MRYQARIPVENGISDADPLTAPEAVPGDRYLLLERQPDSEVPCDTIILALTGVTAGSVTVEMWGIDDNTASLGFVKRRPEPSPAIEAAEVGSAVVTAGNVLQIPNVQAIGPYIARITASVGIVAKVDRTPQLVIGCAVE